MSHHNSPATPPVHLVTLADAAAHFHVSVKTLRRRIADGTITGYRIGRLIRVDLDELTRRLVVAIPVVHSTRPNTT
ncbi:helix-turn-helix domain-containing protein [Myceligenerans salitolerans]|uniref:Helix-turn-helix domain-containing protein n=1 Tax=Myceligenerans salitolerans TaxID=1230528 RepID=A0ABS3I3I3_9MICO|nr:helix-turn-helix domain-containing protein [Myceligenerans salitolerans]MBO0607551.1 helix-turn-helix domain-containing protein [Myceligenerans salitolerans]